MKPDREQAVSQAFVALADTLVDDYDVIDLLDRLVAHSVALLTADAAAIMLSDAHQNLRVLAASSDDAELMEVLQLQNEQGPCLDCYRSGTPVSVPDLAQVAEQWPAFVAAAGQAGAFRSVHALPLRLRGEAIGALDLFHHTPGPLPVADLQLGQALADVATIGILQERAIRQSETPQRAAADRPVQPGGHRTGQRRLAQYHGLSMEASFERLRRYSRDRRLRLAEVSRQLANGELDPAALSSLARPGTC